MNYEKINLKYKGKNYSIKAKKCVFFNKFLGLMFKRKSFSTPLVFNFKKQVNLKIHSFFVFFPFLAIWFDEDNKIIETKKVMPFRKNISPKRKFKSLLEIPFFYCKKNNIPL